jgi:hypothetical protein
LTVRDLALAIEIPIRLDQRFDNVRVSLLKHVKQVVCGDNIGFTPRKRFGDAEQAHNVGTIGVEILAARMLVTI